MHSLQYMQTTFARTAEVYVSKQTGHLDDAAMAIIHNPANQNYLLIFAVFEKDILVYSS